MMTKKPADSVKLEITSSPPDKDGNENDLAASATAFFGHGEATTTGFRHHLEDGGETLYTSAIFYDETTYA